MGRCKANQYFNQYNPNSKYLGIILDKLLTYRVHCEKTKMKINASNGLLYKLIGFA